MQTLKDILKGIDYIHSLKPYPVYHRDIKSANVLVCIFSSKIVFFYFALFCFAYFLYNFRLLPIHFSPSSRTSFLLPRVCARRSTTSGCASCVTSERPSSARRRTPRRSPSSAGRSNTSTRCWPRTTCTPCPRRTPQRGTRLHGHCAVKDGFLMIYDIILFYFALFYFILFYFILFYFICLFIFACCDLIFLPLFPSGFISPFSFSFHHHSDIYSFGILFWEVLYRCFNGSYGRPWWSQYDLTTPCDALIRAQEGVCLDFCSLSF